MGSTRDSRSPSWVVFDVTNGSRSAIAADAVYICKYIDRVVKSMKIDIDSEWRRQALSYAATICLPVTEWNLVAVTDRA